MIILKGINFQTKKKVIDVGPLEVNKTESHHIGWPTYASAGIGVIGIILLGSGVKRTESIDKYLRRLNLLGRFFLIV